MFICSRKKVPFLNGFFLCLFASCGHAESHEVELHWDPQTPPVHGQEVRAWIASENYKTWNCESSPRLAKNNVPHKFVRICTNSKLSTASSIGEIPEGSAAIKEIYETIDGPIVGYSLYWKTKPTSQQGANFYWFESRGAEITADGFGTGGIARFVCADCHSKAGPSFSPDSRDFVYTIVR